MGQGDQSDIMSYLEAFSVFVAGSILYAAACFDLQREHPEQDHSLRPEILFTMAVCAYFCRPKQEAQQQPLPMITHPRSCNNNSKPLSIPRTS